MVVGVLVELSNKNIDKIFDYSVPLLLTDKIKLGIRVLVPFGKQTLEGFIVEIKTETHVDTKSIINIIDDEHILSKELLALGKIMQEKTLSTLISCYQTMLPKALKAKKGTKINKKYDTYYKLGSITGKINDKQEEIINLFKEKKLVEKKEIINISSSSLKTLVNRGVLIPELKEHYRLEYENRKLEQSELTIEQKRVVAEINDTSDQVYLLHGVTGSGKTEVYMELISKVLKEGKTAIVLVPEISLTPQMIQRFTKKFGQNIAAIHSALSEGEKYDEWRRIYRKEANIVIGARSALFSPIENLGIIIIDEEHSDTYKQDDSNPRYDAKEMAIERSKLNPGCKVVLGSATPSLESFARSQKHIYHLVSLPNRINQMPLPEIKIIDMNNEIKTSKGHFSNELLKKIGEKIGLNEQIILLLNRRGYSSFVSCKNCGYVAKCPFCDITLTYHLSTNNLRCHYCGYATKKIEECPNCQENSITTIGVGTEKIEEELKKYIKEARVVRMDFDTTSRKGAHKKIITAFKEKKYDILLGTQIVAKGLDFEDVTLVGVINADTSLNIPDFRSSETTFSLLSQVAGRSGRSKKRGEVIIQTYNPNHYAIEYVKKHDYIGFYQKEMLIRKELKYSPYYFLTYIRVSGKDSDICYQEALKIRKSLEKYLTETIILGPSSNSIFKINNIYRYGIILKYKKQDNLYYALNKMIEAYKSNRKVVVDLNFNPRHFI